MKRRKYWVPILESGRQRGVGTARRFVGKMRIVEQKQKSLLARNPGVSTEFSMIMGDKFTVIFFSI